MRNELSEEVDQARAAQRAIACILFVPAERRAEDGGLQELMHWLRQMRTHCAGEYADGQRHLAGSRQLWQSAG